MNCEDEKNEMYIGVVLDFMEEKGKGQLIIIGSIPACSSDFKYKFCEFNLTECRTTIHKFKLVLVSKIEPISSVEKIWKRFSFFDGNKCTYNALVINDNYPKLKKEFFHTKNKKSWDYLMTEIPYSNPTLFWFFANSYEIDNQYNHTIKCYPGQIIRTIFKIGEIIENLDSFSIQKAIDSYTIILDGFSTSRPGRDDSAQIFIEARRNYWYKGYHDPYIDELLPEFHKVIKRISLWTAHYILLERLWQELGENKKEELLSECEKIRSEKINSFRKNYSKEAHLKALTKHMNKTERNLRLKIEMSIREKEIY